MLLARALTLTSAIGYEKGEIPYTGMVSFAADEALIAAAKDAIALAAPGSSLKW